VVCLIFDAVQRFSHYFQLHAIVVDILASEVRRKRMRRLIRQLCDQKYKSLVPIRSMPIRWNTTLAEIERSIKLKPVRAYFP
jgi:hypothetical protein